MLTHFFIHSFIHSFIRSLYRLELRFLEQRRNYKLLEKELQEFKERASGLQRQLDTKEHLYENLQETLEKVHERRLTSDATLENASEQMQRLGRDFQAVAQERDMLDESTRELSQELSEMRQRLEKFDFERDKLLADLDGKDEQIHELSNCVEDLIREVKEHQQRTDTFRQNEMLLNGHVEDQEKEITSLRSQISLLTTERNQLLKDVQEKMDSTRKIQSDNRAIARESQIVQEDLNEASKQKVVKSKLKRLIN